MDLKEEKQIYLFIDDFDCFVTQYTFKFDSETKKMDILQSQKDFKRMDSYFAIDVPIVFIHSQQSDTNFMLFMAFELRNEVFLIVLTVLYLKHQNDLWAFSFISSFRLFFLTNFSFQTLLKAQQKRQIPLSHHLQSQFPQQTEQILTTNVKNTLHKQTKSHNSRHSRAYDTPAFSPSRYSFVVLFFLLVLLGQVSSIDWLAVARRRESHWNRTSLCRSRRVQGIYRQQRRMCSNNVEMMMAVNRASLQTAQVCQELFYESRWNCSSILKAPKFSPDLTRGSREQAIVYALASASLLQAVSKACSSGFSSKCSCARPPPSGEASSEDFKWGGCGDDVRFGEMYSKAFTDYVRSKRKRRSALMMVNLHNSRVGRETMIASIGTSCKCHGVSGSCSLKTCWKSLPTLKTVGVTLAHKYLTAVEVTLQSQAFESSRRGSRSHLYNDKVGRVVYPYWLDSHRRYKGGRSKRLVRKGVISERNNFTKRSTTLNKQYNTLNTGYSYSQKYPHSQFVFKTNENIHSNQNPYMKYIQANKNAYKNTFDSTKPNSQARKKHKRKLIKKSKIYNFNNDQPPKESQAPKVKKHKKVLVPVLPFKKSYSDGDLLYIAKSPDYCLPQPTLGSVGTQGRECQKEEQGSSGCKSMCCGRGFDTVVQEVKYRCDCKYYWCCYVKCKFCSKLVEINTCK